MTLEADGTGAIYPAVYVRRNGAIEERLMTPHPLLDYDTPDARVQLADILGTIIPSYGSVYSGKVNTVDGYVVAIRLRR